MIVKTFTIVRNGKIKQLPKGPHKCGFPRTTTYPYRVELTVRGHLRQPDFFIVRNEKIHEAVIGTFAHKPSMSCERMCDEMCQAVLDLMTQFPHWEPMRHLCAVDWH